MKASCVALALLCLASGAPVSAAEERAEFPTSVQIEALEADFQRNGEVWRAYVRKDYAAALETAVPLANQGSAIAQYVLGELRLVGTELDGDPAAAIGWFERAAAVWSPPALSRLATIYRAGYGADRDPVRARELSVRWARSNAATAGYYAEKAKPFLFVRLGDAAAHQYWIERSNFFHAYANLIRVDVKSLPIPSESQQIPLRTLPAACRPKAPPARAMALAKIDRLEGSITLMANAANVIEGMVVDDVEVHSLRIAALDVFQKAFRAPECIMNWQGGDRPVQIPFRFQVY